MHKIYQQAIETLKRLNWAYATPSVTVLDEWAYLIAHGGTVWTVGHVVWYDPHTRDVIVKRENACTTAKGKMHDRRR